MTKNNPSFVSHGDSSPTTSVRPEIDAFLAKMKGALNGRVWHSRPANLCPRCHG